MFQVPGSSRTRGDHPCHGIYGIEDLWWILVESCCWFNGNIPWNLGLKHRPYISLYMIGIPPMNRFLASMAIDFLVVPNYGLKRLPLKSFWNVNLYCGLPTTRMFLGCLFFSWKQHQGESKFACDVGRPIFSVCSIIIVWCLWSDFFVLSACTRIISIHLYNFSKL